MSGAKLPVGLDRLPSGKVRARYRDDEGRQHSRSFPDRGGIRAAQAWLREQRAAVDTGTHVAPNSKITVREYAETWAASRPHNGRTRTQDTQYLRHLDASPLGARPLRAVRPSEVQAFVTHRQDAGYAPQTVRNVYTFVKAVFASAVDDRIIGFTPCVARTALPRIDKPKVVPLTIDRVRALADATQERYAIGMLLQGALGLRISELLGLQVRDVDFLRRTVSIERQLAKNGRDFVGLKYESRRTIPLAAEVAEALAAHLAAHPANADGVILNTIYGNPVRSDHYSEKVFRPAADKTPGIPEGTTSHDLRHHFASVLLSRGVPANVVAEYLGHTSPRLVHEVYGHLMPDAEEVTRSALDALWEPIRGIPSTRMG